jgi:hypothetical protein
VLNDVEPLGWDLGSRFYWIRGSLDDPLLELWGQLTEDVHPYDVLASLPPIPLPWARSRNVVGIALYVEGWKVAPAPEYVDAIKLQAGVLWDDDPIGHMDRATFCDEAVKDYLHMVPAAEHPDRRECRQISLRITGGRGAHCIATRGVDELEVLAWEDAGGRMPDMLDSLMEELDRAAAV